MSEISSNFKKENIVFHYCKTSVAIENILFGKQLRLSSRKKSIDPIEKTKPLISDAVTGSSDEVVERIIRETQEDAEKIKQNIDSRLDDTRQVCFCMNNIKNETHEDYGFIKARMWDRYGDGYKGVCLAFSKEKLLNLNKEKIRLSNNVRYLTYEDLATEYIEIDRNDIKKFRYKKYNKYLLDYVDKTLFWKNLDYIGENEFRICTLSENEYDYINIENCIVGIIAPLGQINSYSLKILRKYAKCMDFDLIDISWKNNSVSYCKDPHIHGEFKIFYNAKRK